VLLTKYQKKNYKENFKIVFNRLWKNCIESRERELKQKDMKKRIDLENKDKVKKDLLKRRNELVKESIPSMTAILDKYFRGLNTKDSFERIKEASVHRKDSKNESKPEGLKEQ
jgi:hypothetical protein